MLLARRYHWSGNFIQVTSAAWTVNLFPQRPLSHSACLLLYNNSDINNSSLTRNSNINIYKKAFSTSNNSSSNSSSSIVNGSNSGATNSVVQADMHKLQKEVIQIKEKLQVLEESRAANALVALYASRRLRTFDVKEDIKIFAADTIHSPIYCHNQLPTILGHYITGLDNLPAGLNAMPSILSVRETLLQSFKKLLACDIPVTEEKEKEFCEVLEEIEEAHAERDLLTTMAMGILELKEHLLRHKMALLELKKTKGKWSNLQIVDSDTLLIEELEEIQEPMNFCNRCMITYNFLSRMLLNIDRSGTSNTKLGLVDLEINLEKVVRNAIYDAKQICTDHYGDCPDTEVVMAKPASSFRFPYMSTTIQYVVVELMKNAFRATVEAHMKRNEAGIVTCEDMPPVRILIHLDADTQHACICISDEGMGMTQEALQMAMAYSYTTVHEPSLKLKKKGKYLSEDEMSAPLAGYGYGIPMSRVYAQAFGGDVQLQTMEGYGTRAYYYIKANEQIKKYFQRR